MSNEKKINYQLFFRQLSLLVADGLVALASSAMALWLRYNFSVEEINPIFLENVWKYAIPNIVSVIVIFWLFRLYRSIWLYAGLYEMQQIVFAVCTATLVHFLELILTGAGMPRTYWFFYLMFLGMFTVLTRFSYRLLRRVQANVRGFKNSDEISRTMVVGAGSAADILIHEMKSSSHLNMHPVCIVDDDPRLRGKMLRGIRIVGNTNDIPEVVKKFAVEDIVIAMPSVSKKRIAEITNLCNTTGCTIRTLPGVYQLVNQEVSVSKLRPVEIEDLLGREPVKVDIDRINGFLAGQTVLVTGGGGSIGSELCRQIAAARPAKLIILDIYENNAYDIQQELIMSHPELDLTVLIASVRDVSRIESIFEEYRPSIVFHAAAHKHVPLMEGSPNEAIKNNVFGTLAVASAADKFGTKRFVMISTDKAVNPTNVMGASKRICEMIIQAYSRKSETQFVAVRFGNVLGSNGSVIPLFKKQINAGGPVRVTHPDIIRYFMTIPEAVSLVLEAGAYAGNGEIYVLDMGEPVRIADLAENLIRLSGYIPNEDIMIEYTGLRPGEKLYEERLMDEEGLEKTENDLISVAKPIEMDDELFFKKLDKIYGDAYSEGEDIRDCIADIVPTYRPE
ncbi:MAG: polysaccharide biosynthesis protein [Lachnospiraceae bacterium]|nr:polysaccharide biosynthesis protein [Lachnospiraceae bacterium]